MMTSRERVFTALDRGQPDRVPLLEFIIDPSVWKTLVPQAADMAEAMDKLNFDGVGCGAHFRRTKENPDGSYTDEWGVLYHPGPEAIDHPASGPITTLKEAWRYEPPDPDSPERLGKLQDLVRRYGDQRAICFHHRAAFMWSAYLLGMENLLVAFMTEPELAETVMDKVLECNMRIVRNAIRAGADVIILGDDYAANAAPLFSPDHFRQFIAPRLKKMVDMIHHEGARVIKHSDGNLYPILEDIVDCGPDALNPFEPVAGMHLKDVKSKIGDRVCITGNIDCGQLLPRGTREEVRRAVKQAIADAGEGGGYILTSSNSIHSSCNPENLRAMIEACFDFGQYENN